jgi:hypothetical protein
MKKHLLILILLISSCASYRQKQANTVKMNAQGEVIYVCHQYQLALVRFTCSNQPYKLQPCYRDVFFDLQQIGFVEVGMRWPG